MNRITLFIGALFIASALNAQGKDVPKPYVEKTPALEIAKVQRECAGPRSKKCQAHELLDAAQIHFLGAEAETSMSVFDVEYAHKSRLTVAKQVALSNASIQKTALPLIDHALTLPFATNIVDDIKKFKNLALKCSAQMGLSKDEPVEEYKAKMDSCSIPAQAQLDATFVALGYSAQKPPVGFRKAAWGDSKNQVIAIEGKPAEVLNGGDVLFYRNTLVNHEVFVYFTFIQGKLVSGAYFFKEEHTDDNAFIDDYNAIASSLDKKYGKPYTHETTWNNPLFENDKAHWGIAVATGQAHMLEAWSLSDTNIMHALDGDNFKVTHFIRYTSVQYKYLLDKSERAKELQGL